MLLLIGMAVALALVLAPSALPRGAGFITVKPGDELDVVGTRILCKVAEKGIYCVKVDGKGPLPGSYAVGISLKSGIAAWKIDAKRNVQQVYARKLASAQKRIKIRVRQVARIPGTTVDCAIVLSGAKNDEETIYCSRDDKVGPVVGSYAVLMSDSMVAVGKIKADRSTTIVWTKKHTS